MVLIFYLLFAHLQNITGLFLRYILVSVKKFYSSELDHVVALKSCNLYNLQLASFNSLCVSCL